MEWRMRGKVWNSEPMSKSYIGGIGRIVGTRTSNFQKNSFEKSKGVMEETKKSWNRLLNKPSGEVSDEFEFGVETFGTRENIDEGDDDFVKQRLPTRKSPSMVQYWVNTGYLPYNAGTDQDKYSESGSSLSEEELSYLQNSPTRVQDLYKNKARKKEDSNSSCSSVDTAAYILSNTNTTKKAESMPIVEGAKYPHSEGSECIAAKNTGAVCLTTNIKLARLNNSSQESEDDSQILLNINDQKKIVRRSERLKNTHKKEPVLSNYKESSYSDENEVGKENFISSSSVSSSNCPANITNLESTEDAETVKDNPPNSQKVEIPKKYEEKDAAIESKYPVVRLERISPSEIKKHMSNRSIDEETVISPLRNTIELNRRSVTNIQLPRKSLRSKNSSQPSSKKCNSKLLGSCQIQNVDEDVDSTQSTVLLCECKNRASHECHSASEASSFMNDSSQDIVYNMANNCSYNSSSDENQKNKNFDKCEQNNTSYVRAQIKTSEQEPANMLRKDRSSGSCKEQAENGLSKEEILEKIKCIKALVVLERLPQEKLCNIKRYTRKFPNEKKKSEIKDSTLTKPVSIDTSTAQLTNDTSKTDSKKGVLCVGTHTYDSQQFQQKRTINPINMNGSDVSELKCTKDRKRPRAIAIISSDEEQDFINLIKNCRSAKRRRTKSRIKSSNISMVNIVDTTDEESDVLVNHDNRKNPSEKVGSAVHETKRSMSQRKASWSEVAFRKKALERWRTSGEHASSTSDVSAGIFTSTRVNRRAISPAAIGTRETSSSPIIVENRISTTVRTPTKNNASPRRSFSETPNKFEHSIRVSGKKVRDSVTPRVPGTCLRFQTRLFDSDTESLSVSSNSSLLLE